MSGSKCVCSNIPGPAVLFALSLTLAPLQPAAAQEPGDRALIVGTKQAAPFAMQDEDGEWSGISIELWRGIAAELELGYELRERELQGLIDGLADGELDASVAALTVTAAREARVDFTHPFYTSGLGIAVPGREASGWLLVLERFISPAFLKVVGALVLVLLIAGALVWIFERRENPEQFGGGTARGLGAAFWWSAVTMTTVGYGDKAPRSVGGRAVALIWMFTSVIIVSGFTAAIASSLTVGELGSPIQGPEDLHRARIGTVPGSTSERYLQGRRLTYQSYETPRHALEALAADRVDAVVYDAPILRYLASHELQGVVRVLDRTFERQDYAIALPEGSALREPISRAILERIGRPDWQELLNRYMGRR